VDEPAREFHPVRLLCIVLAAASAVGCANHKPLMGAKVAQAERAVEEAQQAGAAINAPLEFRTAQDKLRAAQEAMKEGNHERAIRSADEATIDAEYARARAANQRLNTMADEMGQSIKALRQELERLPK
jgi:Domain of unknown function (DUF4398)